MEQYFISFTAIRPSGATFFGNAAVRSPKPITGFHDILDIQKTLEARFGVRDLVVLSWQPLKDAS
jgi:hypothetical protein